MHIEYSFKNRVFCSKCYFSLYVHVKEYFYVAECTWSILFMNRVFCSKMQCYFSLYAQEWIRNISSQFRGWRILNGLYGYIFVLRTMWNSCLPWINENENENEAGTKVNSFKRNEAGTERQKLRNEKRNDFVPFSVPFNRKIHCTLEKLQFSPWNLMIKSFQK